MASGVDWDAGESDDSSRTSLHSEDSAVESLLWSLAVPPDGAAVVAPMVMAAVADAGVAQGVVERSPSPRLASTTTRNAYCCWGPMLLAYCCWLPLLLFCCYC